MCHQCGVLLTMVAKEGLCEEMTSNLGQGGTKALRAMRLNWPRNDKVTGWRRVARNGGVVFSVHISLCTSLCAMWEGV